MLVPDGAFRRHRGNLVHEETPAPEIVEEMGAAFARCVPVISPSTVEVNKIFIVRKAKLEVFPKCRRALVTERSYVETQREKVVGRQLSSDEEIEPLVGEVKRLRKPAPDPRESSKNRSCRITKKKHGSSWLPSRTEGWPLENDWPESSASRSELFVVDYLL